MDKAQQVAAIVLTLSTLGLLWLAKVLVLDRVFRTRPTRPAAVVPPCPTGYPQISDYERSLALGLMENPEDYADRVFQLREYPGHGRHRKDVAA